MSPEQILSRGVAGPADVFSLGAVLAYAATGVPPFPGDSSASLLYKVVHEEPELGALSGELREVVAECLVKSAQDRPTPAEVARRLAPEGAARLVAAGWLPGALVEQVGRSAVQLLNLEAVGEQPSGPVGFSSPSVGGGPAGASDAVGSSGSFGAFGPPPVMPVVSAGAPPAPAAGPPAFPLTPPDFTGGPFVPEPRDAAPQEGAAHETVVPSDRSDRRPGPGKLSVSVAAASTSGDNGRGRRLSCTVALAVAGALAAVTVGSVLVFDLLPGRGDDDSTSSASGNDSYSSAPTSSSTASAPSDSSPSAPVPSPAPTSAAASAPAAVPARYLGTWEGQGSGLDGAVPMGTFRITVEQVGVGGELGRLRQTDVLGAVCTDILTLKKATDTELVTTAVGAEDNHAGCNPTAHTVRLTAAGDDLKYTSESEAEGYPEARMSKVG
jgi:hypothetical protein